MQSMFVTYASLLAAIVLETAATSFLKESEQFTRFWPSLAHGGRVCRRFLSAVGNPEGDAGGDSLCALERFGNCVDFPDRCAGV